MFKRTIRELSLAQSTGKLYRQFQLWIIGVLFRIEYCCLYAVQSVSQYKGNCCVEDPEILSK